MFKATGLSFHVERSFQIEYMAYPFERTFPKNYAFDGESHNFIEIVYILSGNIEQTINGQIHEVKRGDVLFMNTDCTHTFDSDSKYSYINILFSPHIVEDADSSAHSLFSLFFLSTFNEICSEADFGKISFNEKERDEIEFIVIKMLNEYEEKKPSWETVVGSYLNILITQMLRKIHIGIDSKEIDDMWDDLVKYIESNLSSKLTLTSLARKCFYNPSYFSRVFKEKFGMTLSEYITRKRLDHAVSLLNETELSIEEISERCGFSDRSSFYHFFSRYLGTSPNSYRK